MNAPENPPAFPVNASKQGEFGLCNKGMTLRDWFAGRALAGYLAENPHNKVGGLHAAAKAYAYADAMLAERAKGGAA